METGRVIGKGEKPPGTKEGCSASPLAAHPEPRRHFRPPGFRCLFCLLLFLVSPVSACQICMPMPTESLADQILASEHLVLAREDPEKPYTLNAITWLKRGAKEPTPVGLFLDSSSRRQLSNDENLAVLCGWSPKTGEWERLALHDEILAPVVATILKRAESWRQRPDDRLDYFAGFLGHEESTLSDLAHIEVARAPYGKLLACADRIPREKLHEELENYRRTKWHALYILLLGRSDNPSDHAFIRRELADAARYGLAAQTAAWATAFLEIDGVGALAQLRDLYGGGNIRRLEERKAILGALVIHGDKGETELRNSIVELLGEFLEAEPALAPDLASALTRWNRDDLAGPVAALLQDSSHPLDLSSSLVLRRYLRESSKKALPPSTAFP